MDADLTLALELVALADEVTLRRFRAHDLQVATKPDLTPVSEADHAAEELIRDRLATAHPGDAVLGEEFGTDGDAARRWIIDPIDGTKNYVRGVPVWATLLALEEDGVMRVGVVSAPALGHTWWAVRGGGAFADGAPIAVSKVHAVEDAHLCYSDFKWWAEFGLQAEFEALARRVWRTRGFGDFWSHILVAEGAADIAAEPTVALWDLAPLLVIVEEAGGRFTDLAGRSTADGGSAVSTNGLLHDEVLAALTPEAGA
ncbi:MAG: histidinol-phosphatase [Acidimicrobiia bacterium]